MPEIMTGSASGNWTVNSDCRGNMPTAFAASQDRRIDALHPVMVLRKTGGINRARARHRGQESERRKAKSES